MNMETTEKKKPNVFTDGPITPEFIAHSIAKHSTKTSIGGHDIFLGQVRKDQIGDQTVKSIVYTTTRDLAEQKLYELREETFSKFNIICLHIYHSLGEVKAGEICLFVFVSAAHRHEAFDATRWLVEQIKKEVPIWGQEMLENGEHVWKENKL